MARSDPPFDAADEATTQPPQPRAASESAREPEAAVRQNRNWFEPGFDRDDETDDRPTVTVMRPQPMEPPPGERAREIVTESPPVERTAVERESAPIARPREARAEPASVQPAEPRAMENITAEIAAALRASEPRRAPAMAFAHVAPSAAASYTRAETLSSAAYAPAPAQEPQSRIGDLIVRAGKVMAIIAAAWFCVVLVLIALYRFINPPFSSLMAAQWLTGTTIHREWVPLDSISPNLIQAVVVSEDGRFCEHWGIDFVEIAEALKRSPHGVPRGASTITMQVAKNLFLWPAKSYVRKVIEVPLTYAIELFWPKRRILEVYLNIAEWGPGIFGAEAASQAHFGHPASRLSSREAAQLAVALPNPIVRDAGDPGPRTAHRASVIQRRAGGEPEAIACILGGE